MCKSRQRLTNLPSPLAGEGSGERETVMTFMIGAAGKAMTVRRLSANSGAERVFQRSQVFCRFGKQGTERLGVK